jgi:hypothetical protein
MPAGTAQHAHDAWARREHQGGDPAAGYTTVKTRRFLRVNKLQASAYTLLYLDLHEVVEKGVLTSEAVGAAATDGVDGGNGCQVGEGAPSCTRAPRTLGKVLPVMRSKEVGAHR